MSDKKGYRLERDSMGNVPVPEHAYWGAQTQRAIRNFPISGLVFPRSVIKALGIIKLNMAQTNIELELLNEEIGNLIIKSSQEVMRGIWDNHFVVDVFQTGSGTSLNMNANEVIANRSNEMAGHQLGQKTPVHPNDHVNLGQSSNDVIPSAIHIAVVESISNELLPVLYQLHRELANKARQYRDIVKVGRTHLQDALPITLGQEFGGYEAMIKKGIRRVKNALPNLMELPLGGTAVGTGLNAHPELAQRAIGKINELTGFSFKEAENHFEAQGARDAIVEASATLRMLSGSVLKIANDIRWMGSGPYGGIGELFLPSVQPGSSMMPGKSNPVIPEALIQTCVQVMGNDTAVSIAGHMGHFELNSMIPLMGNNILQSISFLSNGIRIFSEMCIKGIRANQRHCSELLEKNVAMITVLAPVIGYEYASDIASEAFRTRQSLKTVLLKRRVLSEKKIDSILNPLRLTMSGKSKDDED